jgi:hypothetical protein
MLSFSIAAHLYPDVKNPSRQAGASCAAWEVTAGHWSRAVNASPRKARYKTTSLLLLFAVSRVGPAIFGIGAGQVKAMAAWADIGN